MKPINVKYLVFFIITRKFIKPNYSFRRVLPEEEFVKTFVSWIEARDIIDNCFVLNFGFAASLPWPQVKLFYILNYKRLCLCVSHII